MEEKKIVEMSLDDLKKIVGGQGESIGEGNVESKEYHCTKCGGTKFRIWRESPMALGYYITCEGCGDTRYFDIRYNPNNQ